MLFLSMVFAGLGIGMGNGFIFTFGVYLYLNNRIDWCVKNMKIDTNTLK